MVSSVDGDSIDLPPASQPAASRIKTYEKIIGLAKDKKSEVSLRNTFKKLSTKTAAILEDVLSDNRQLVEASLQTLGLLLKDDDAVRSFSPIVMSSVLSTLCDVLLKTDDKTIASRALWCLAKQTFPADVLVAHVHPIVGAVECVLNHVGPSAAVAYEGLDLIFVLLQRLPKQMSSVVTRWSPIVFDHLTACAERVSERAAAVFELGLPAMQAARSEIAGILVVAVKKNLSTGLSRNVKTHRTAVDALQSWSIIVRLLGRKLHRSPIISLLLPCLEAAFRSGSGDVRVAAFSAWRALCDNFAEDRDFLLESKRMNLIMQAFRARNAKVEAVARAKFECWWHYICLLRDAALQQPQFDSVVVPLLNFCFATELQSPAQPLATLPNGSTTPVTPRSSRQVATSASPSPTIVVKPDTPGGPEGQVYGFLKALGAEVLANVLGASESASVLPERLPPGMRIADEVLIRSVAPLTTAIRISLVENTDAKTSTRGASLWSTFIDRIVGALDSCTAQAAADTTATVFDTLRFTVLALSTADDRSGQCESCLGIVKDFLRLPSSCLTSLLPSGPASNGLDEPLLIALADLVLIRLMALITSSVDEARLGALVDRIIALGTGSSTSTAVLDFCEKIVNVLDRQAVQPVRSQHQHNARTVVWLALANRVIQYLKQGGDINQGTNVEYGFGCLYRLLLFPIKWFSWSSLSESQCAAVLSRWEALCKGLSKEASLVVCAPPNIWCEDMCHEILQHWGGIQDVLTDELGLSKLASMLLCICDVLDNSTPTASSSSRNQRSKGKALSSYNSLVKLLAKLLGILANKPSSVGAQHSNDAFASNQIETSPKAVAICSACSIAMTAAHRLLQRVYPPYVGDTAVAMCNAVTSAVGTPGNSIAVVFNRFELLWEAVINSLQLRHAGPYDVKLLDALVPLLIAALSHEKHDVRRHALSFWNSTFGQTSRESELPGELRAALAKATQAETRTTSAGRDAGASSASQPEVESLGSSQVELPRIPGLPSPQKLVGSFLGRARASPSKPLLASRHSPAKVSPASPARAAVADSGSAAATSVAPTRGTASPSVRKSSPAVSAKRGSPASAPRRDEFVFIAPSPHKKLVLTEHQKEKLKEKRILPTMYNGLEASQDTTCFMASQEDSVSQCAPSAAAVAVAAPDDSVKVVESSIGLSDAAEFVDLNGDAGTKDHTAAAAFSEARALDDLRQHVDRGSQSIELVCSSQPSVDLEPRAIHDSAPSAECLSVPNFIPTSPHRQRNTDAGASIRSPVRRPLQGSRGRRTPASTGKIGPGLLKWFAAIPNVGESACGITVAADSSVCAPGECIDDSDVNRQEAAGRFPSNAVPDDELLAHPMDDDAKRKMNSASYIHVRRERRLSSSNGGEANLEDNRSLSGGLSAVERSEVAVPSPFASCLLLHGEISRPTDNCRSPSADEIEQIVLEKSFETEQVFPTSQGVSADFDGILATVSDGSQSPTPVACEKLALTITATSTSPVVGNNPRHDESLPLISDQAPSPAKGPSSVADVDPADAAEPRSQGSTSGSDSGAGSTGCTGGDDSLLVLVGAAASVGRGAALKRKRNGRADLESAGRRPVTRRKSCDPDVATDSTEAAGESASSPSYAEEPSPKRRRRPSAKAAAATNGDVPVTVGSQSRRRGRPAVNASAKDVSVQGTASSLSSSCTTEELGEKSLVDTQPTGVPPPTGTSKIRRRGRPSKNKADCTKEANESSYANYERASMQPRVVIGCSASCDTSVSIQIEPQRPASLDPVYLADTVPDEPASFVAECVPSAPDACDGSAGAGLTTEVNVTSVSGPEVIETDPSEVLPAADSRECEMDHRSQAAELQCPSSAAAAAASAVGDSAAAQTCDLKPSSGEQTVPFCSSPRSVASYRANAAGTCGRSFGKVSARLGGSLKCAGGMSRSAEILRRSLDLSAAAAAASGAVADSPPPPPAAAAAAAARPVAGSGGNGATATAAAAAGSSTSSSRGLVSSPQRPTVGGGLSTAPYAYSPSASPSGSILKRRSIVAGMIEGGQSPSPSTKSRRVSFAATVEVSCNDQDQKDSRLLSNLPGIGQASILLEETETRPEHSDVRDNFAGDGTGPQPAGVSASSSADEQGTLSSAVYQSTPESQLDCHLPFFPDLVGSCISVDVLTPHLTTSVWSAGLTNLLKARSIHTVGDLASLTAYDIHNLPIRAPKLVTARKALQGVLQESALVTPTSRSVQCSSKAESLACRTGDLLVEQTHGDDVVVPAVEQHACASSGPQPMDVEPTSEPEKTSTDYATVNESSLAISDSSCVTAGVATSDMEPIDVEKLPDTEPIDVEKLPDTPLVPASPDHDPSLQQPDALSTIAEPVHASEVLAQESSAAVTDAIAVRVVVDGEGATDAIPVNVAVVDSEGATDAIAGVAIVDCEGASDSTELSGFDSDVMHQQSSDDACRPQADLAVDEPACSTDESGASEGDEVLAAHSQSDKLPAPQTGTSVSDDVSTTVEAASRVASAAGEADRGASHLSPGLVGKLLSVQGTFSAELRQLPTSDLFCAHAVLGELTAAVISELKARCCGASSCS